MTRNTHTNIDIIQPASLPSDSVESTYTPDVVFDRTLSAHDAMTSFLFGIAEADSTVLRTKRELVQEYLVGNIVTEDDIKTAVALIKGEYDSPVRRAEFGAVIRAVAINPRQVAEFEGGWNDLVTLCRNIAPSNKTQGKKSGQDNSSHLSTKKVTKIVDDLAKATPSQMYAVATAAVDHLVGDVAIDEIVSKTVRNLTDVDVAIRLAALILEVASGLTEQEAPVEAITGARVALDDYLDTRETLKLEASQAMARNSELVLQQPETV